MKDIADKIVIVATHGAEDAERATIPFVMANAAFGMGTEAVVILQVTGVTLALKGGADHVFAESLPPLKDLMEGFVEAGGRLLVCSPCLAARKITADKLIDAAEIIAGATVIAEATSARATFNY
jgi:uncharacterized protein